MATKLERLRALLSSVVTERKALFIVIVVSLVVAFGPWVFGMYGGTRIDDVESYRWHGDSSILISFDGGKAGDVGCVIRPDAGSSKGVDIPGSYPGKESSGEFRPERVPSWFDGSAEVRCSKAEVFVGWSSYIVEYWYFGPMLVVIVWAAGLYIRHRMFLKWIEKNRPDLIKPRKRTGRSSSSNE